MADTPAAPAAAPATLSDADLVSNILANQSTDKPADAVTDGEEQATEGDGTETEDADDSHDDEDSADEEAAPSTVKGPLKAALAQVKKGLLDGEIDPKDVGLTNKDWTAYRHKMKADRTALQTEVATERHQLATWQQDAQAKLNNAIHQLTPLEPWYLAEQQFNRDGDVGHLVKVMEERTKLGWDEIQKLVLGRQKLSPEVRRIREQAERDRAEMATMRAELERLKQPKQASPEEVAAADVAHIANELRAHEVAKVPNFAKRVYAVMVKTATRIGDRLSPTLTVEQAAAQVIRLERKRLEASPFYKKPAETEAPPRKGKKGALLRKDSQSEGANPNKPETNDDIVNDLLRKNRAAAGAVGR